MNPLLSPYPLNAEFRTAHLPVQPHRGCICAVGTRTRATLLVLVAALLLTARPTQAANVLLNPSFELNNGNTVPTAWTFFAPPNTSVHDYWIVDTNSTGCSHMAPHSGTYYWKEWFIHNNTNNVAGLYQTFSSSPGAIYQANGWLATSSCDSFGADCATWVQVEFLDTSTNLLALYKSATFSASVALDAWAQFPVTNVCDLSQAVSLGDPYFTTYAVTGSVSQLVAPFGTASVRYRFCYLTVGSEGGSAFFEDAVLNQVSGPAAPVISALFPQDTMIFVNPTSGISFTATSPSGFTINNSGIHLTVNGTDVSGSLAISGSASSKNVAYHGLQTNSAYTVAISVTDASNLTVNASIQFQTMWFGLPPVLYTWEAEDWDFTNGMYINIPDLCNANGDPNCYFGKVGVLGVDENNSSGKSGPYRPDDLMGTAAAGDSLRPNLVAANRTDYRIDPFNGGEWINYTRDWPNSTNWIVARVSANIGDSGALTLSRLNPDSSTTDLGTFSINGGLGYSAFENVFLKDTNGNSAVVTLNGKQTLRVTTSGNVLPNFFMLVPAQVDVPILSNVYPTGTHPFEPTNTFSFTVTATGSSFPANGIRVNLDGFDVTPNLVITGSASTKNVVLPSILSNAIHVAVTTVTNALGHGITVTNQFDTFSQNNYMFELEDFDYDSRQFVDNPQVDQYFARGATTNIDYQHTVINPSEPFVYRVEGIPENGLNGNDFLRDKYVQALDADYVLVFFAANDWANYTRTFPAGTFYAYIRSSGDGPYSMFLDQVVSGAGTTNQVTRRLGRFGGFGRSPAYNVYDWAPLTDDGLAAPTVVTLNGLATLRVTTAGNCNPNFVMLVPTSGIKVRAAASGPNTVLSFPSQAGVGYRVFYRTNLTAGNWTMLTNVLGTGATSSVTDPSTRAGRFYKVSAP